MNQNLLGAKAAESTCQAPANNGANDVTVAGKDPVDKQGPELSSGSTRGFPFPPSPSPRPVQVRARRWRRREGRRKFDHMIDNEVRQRHLIKPGDISMNEALRKTLKQLRSPGCWKAWRSACRRPLDTA